MPTTLEERLAKVREAEAACERAGLAARDSWQSLKERSKAAATPWRIVAVGGVLGFLAGRGNADGAATAKLFGSLAQTLFTMISAGMAAGAADEDTDAAADATAEAEEYAAEDIAGASARTAVEAAT
jgi:hypothetical protein